MRARLGLSLPTVVTPNILKILVNKFNIMPISTPEEVQGDSYLKCDIVEPLEVMT